MKPWQRDQLQRLLNRRREALVEELRGDAARMATPLQDLDASVAALLSDVERADLARDADELRDVEEARQRLADGRYGICVDCGAQIGYERLRAEPAAARCVECQSRHEKTYRR